MDRDLPEGAVRHQVLASCVGALAAPMLVCASAAAGGLPEPADGPYVGPVLDWQQDSADAYVERLGISPSVFGQSLPFPLESDDRRFLEQFVQQTAAHGAIAQLTLEPRLPLSQITTEHATDLGAQVDDLHTTYGTEVVLSFAPEMNGSWRAWGQQPATYREAFRTVASAVRSETDAITMLWAPTYGAGYPFGDAHGLSPGAEPRPVEQLDTTGDGTITEADDPYGPYWPGADVVDRVGLVMYRFGFARPFGVDETPTATELTDRLAERHGYAAGQGRVSFHDRFAVAHDLPMALETAAAWYDEGGTVTEAMVKQAWWRQVFDPALRETFPALDLVTWLEVERPEPEADGRRTDWRVTSDPALARDFSGELREHATTGPVTTPAEGPGTSDGPAGAGDVGRGTVVGAVVFGGLMVVVLIGVAVASRRATG